LKRDANLYVNNDANVNPLQVRPLATHEDYVNQIPDVIIVVGTE